MDYDVETWRAETPYGNVFTVYCANVLRFNLCYAPLPSLSTRAARILLRAVAVTRTLYLNAAPPAFVRCMHGATFVQYVLRHASGADKLLDDRHGDADLYRAYDIGTDRAYLTSALARHMTRDAMVALLMRM